MSTRSNAPKIADFRSETAVVNGVRLHYSIGGATNGIPVLLWHGFLGTSYTWRKVMPLLAEAGFSILVPDMRGYGDSDKPAGTEGYDARALSEEFRELVRQIGFGSKRAILLAAHDMGAPPALLWAAEHPEEVAGLLYIDEPVMLSAALTKIIAYTPEAMKEGSMWWWILPFAPGVPERLVVECIWPRPAFLQTVSPEAFFLTGRDFKAEALARAIVVVLYFGLVAMVDSSVVSSEGSTR